MKIKIITDSAADLLPIFRDQYDISVLPFNVLLGDKTYLDDGFITAEKIFAFVSKTKELPKTAAINQFSFTTIFTKELENHDYIIYIGLSSALSVTYTNALKAAEAFNGRVRIIDSKSLSTGISLLLLLAARLREQGLSINEIVSTVESRVKDVQTSFVVDRLDYLYKGGRCSSLQLLGANLLHIKPKIILTAEGKMVMGGKYRGNLIKVISQYCNDVLDANKADPTIAFITYSSATPEMIAAAKESLEKYGITNIYEATAGATITSHCGENTLGIIFLRQA